LKQLLGDKSDSEPIVIANQICRAVDDRIQVIQGGKKLFPFNLLTVRIQCLNEEEQNIIQSAFDHRKLERHIQEFLDRREVTNSREVRVSVVTSIGAPSSPAVRQSVPFDITYERVEKSLPEATLTVIRGVATPKVFTIKALSKIGRTEEVIDRHGRLVRRNDLVFTDQEDEVNLSVGRIQSRIEYDEETLHFTVFDENSRHGTFVERNGQIKAATGLRGIKLLDGDTLYFGLARCRFRLKSES